MTKAELLKDREGILKELAAIDTLLERRFDVRLSSVNQAAGEFSPEPQIVKNGSKEKKGSASLPYAKLSREWVRTQSGLVSVITFRNWLIAKFPNVEINTASLNAPLKKLHKDGILRVVKKGSGRSPTKYFVIQESLKL